MAKSIVSVLTAQELADLFRKEAKIQPDGKVEFTQRGVSRLTGKQLSAIQNLLSDSDHFFYCNNAESITIKPRKGDHFSGIDDTIVFQIVQYYAFSEDPRNAGTKKRCQQLVGLFGAIGLRASVQNAQHWQSDRSATQQLAWKYILEEPRKWSSQFPDEYYSQLARLTNIHPEGSNRPHYWANLTNEFVYGHLPKEIEDGVRQAKLANATNDRLHQFLKADGLELLQNHLNALMILMSSVSNIEDLRNLVRGRFDGSYQLALKLN